MSGNIAILKFDGKHITYIAELKNKKVSTVLDIIILDPINDPVILMILNYISTMCYSLTLFATDYLYFNETIHSVELLTLLVVNTTNNHFCNKEFHTYNKLKFSNNSEYT